MQNLQFIVKITFLWLHRKKAKNARYVEREIILHDKEGYYDYTYYYENEDPKPHFADIDNERDCRLEKWRQYQRIINECNI